MEILALIPARGGSKGIPRKNIRSPVFAQIAGGSLRSMRVAPDAPLANLVIPAEPVKESM